MYTREETVHHNITDVDLQMEELDTKYSSVLYREVSDLSVAFMV